jgi:ADP-ribose pyrophosphatase
MIVRVYGLIMNNKGELLITDEHQQNMRMTKFPGGGLEFGEGIIDCLKREITEEMGMKLTNIEHFYTTDFFQKALFYADTQLISVYYTATLINAKKFICTTKPFDFQREENGAQSFRWINPFDFSVDNLTFPIDKLVFNKLQTQLQSNKLIVQ